MSYTNSTSMIVANAQVANATALMDAMGRGPETFTIELSPDEGVTVTHMGAHTFDDELAGIVASRVVPEGLDLASKGLTVETAYAALQAIAIYSVLWVDGQSSAVANFEAFAGSLGLARF